MCLSFFFVEFELLLRVCPFDCELRAPKGRDGSDILTSSLADFMLGPNIPLSRNR